MAPTSSHKTGSWKHNRTMNSWNHLCLKVTPETMNSSILLYELMTAACIVQRIEFPKLLRGVEVGVISRPSSHNLFIVQQRATGLTARQTTDLHLHGHVEERLRQTEHWTTLGTLLQWTAICLVGAGVLLQHWVRGCTPCKEQPGKYEGEVDCSTTTSCRPTTDSAFM